MSKKLTLQDIEIIAKARNHNLVCMKNYKGVKSKIKLYCNTCNNNFETSVASYKNSRKTGCPYCKKKVISELHTDKKVSKITRKKLSDSATGRVGSLKGVFGKAHPAFKGTPNRDFNNPSTDYYIWREAIKKRCNRTCVLSGSKKDLVAHHLYSWNLYPDKRYDITNGVLLTKELHKKFHNKYGYGNNTLEQFNLFRQEYNMVISSQASDASEEGPETIGEV